MAHAKITLIGFYKWMLDEGTDIFSDMVLPAGIDKDLLIDNILYRGGEFEVLHADPHYTQYMTGMWSRKWYRTFQKWLDALEVEYDPLNNYNRYEEWEEDRKDDETEESERKGKTGRTMESHQDTPYHTTTLDVSAYDQSGYTAKDKTSVTGHTDENGKEDGTSEDSNKGKRGLVGNLKHKGHMYGNIGVTTSQQMLAAELEVAEWNIYEHITDIYLQEFAIYTY